MTPHRFGKSKFTTRVTLRSPVATLSECVSFPRGGYTAKFHTDVKFSASGWPTPETRISCVTTYFVLPLGAFDVSRQPRCSNVFGYITEPSELFSGKTYEEPRVRGYCPFCPGVDACCQRGHCKSRRQIKTAVLSFEPPTSHLKPPSLANRLYLSQPQPCDMAAVLNAFKLKEFDLEPVYADWPDAPVFNGHPKQDLPVDESLEKIREGCVARNVPEEYWYKVAQHYMGPKAKARFVFVYFLSNATF